MDPNSSVLLLLYAFTQRNKKLFGKLPFEHQSLESCVPFSAQSDHQNVHFNCKLWLGFEGEIYRGSPKGCALLPCESKNDGIAQFVVDRVNTSGLTRGVETPSPL